MRYRTKKRHASLSKYHLRRWSRLVRIRDGYICSICKKPITPRHKAQAHHIMPKILYPERAFDLVNGITVHGHHHQRVVHASQIWWQDYVCYFARKMREPWRRLFNADNQHKIRRKR